MWFRQPQNVTESFEASIRFVVRRPGSPSGSNGADGLAFVIHNDPRPLDRVVGNTGDSLGYASPSATLPAIQPSLAVAVRTYPGAYADVLKNEDDPQVQTFELPSLRRASNLFGSIVDVPQEPTVRYDAPTQSRAVLLNGASVGMDDVALGAPLSTIVEGDTATFGVTAATGGIFSSFEVIGFSIEPIPEPGSLWLVAVVTGMLLARRPGRALLRDDVPTPSRRW